MMETRHPLDLVFETYPILTSGGMGVVLDAGTPKWRWHHWPPPGREAEFEAELKKGRQGLVNRYPAICAIVSWLEACPKIKNKNQWHSSYGLKHLCEGRMLAPKHSTYVSNGEFIAAAILAGFSVYKNTERVSPNPMFNMSERWLIKQQKRERANDYVNLNEWAGSAKAA